MRGAGGHLVGEAVPRTRRVMAVVAEWGRVCRYAGATAPGMRKARQGSLEEVTSARVDRAGPDTGPEWSTGAWSSPEKSPSAQHDTHVTEEETESLAGDDILGITEWKPQPAALTPALWLTSGS